MFGKRTLFMFMGMIALSTAIDPNNICVLLADGLKIVDDTNCAAFYTCQNGKATPSNCPSGYYFNKDSKTCVTKSQATCISTDEQPCAGVADGLFVSMAGSCSGYYYCKNQVATAGQCPNNLNFNPKEQKCQYSNEYACAIAGGNDDADMVVDDPQVVCAYVPEGIFFGNAASCNTWHKCKNNNLVSGTCGTNVFNVQSQECVYENTYNCQQLDGDVSQTGGTPLGDCTAQTVTIKKSATRNGIDNEFIIEGREEGEEIEEGSGNESSEEGGSIGGSSEESGEEDTVVVAKKHRDPDSCSSYLTCVNNKFVRNKCAGGQYFSLTDQKCVARSEAVNKCDRCQGSTLTFVNAHNDDCFGYFTCSNGRKTGSGKCLNNLYFNEKLGSCLSAKVTFQACTKASYTGYDALA